MAPQKPRRPASDNARAMWEVLTVTFPFFALVLCGYLACKSKVLPVAAIGGLNSFVLFFALPCMLYRFGASTPVTQMLNPAVMALWAVCALVMVAFVLAISFNARVRWNDAAFGALVGAFPNSGFMGVPLLVALLGPMAAGPTIATMMVDMIVTTSLCIALSRLDPPPGLPAGSGLKAVREAGGRALRGVLTNPMPWSIVLGAAASATAFELPGPVHKTVGLLADAASPVALFTIGAVLARPLPVRDGLAHALPPIDYVPAAVAKLLLHPLLVLLLGSAAVQAGLPLDAGTLTVLVLVAALPSASNVSLLAERFEANTARVARIILVSTALAFVSFSGAVSLLKT